MSQLLRLLADQALLLAAGTTVLLSLGSGAMLLCKSPVHRQRISELAIAGVLAWMVLALFPLPRLLPDYFAAGSSVAEVPREGALTETPLKLVESLDPILLSATEINASSAQVEPLNLPQIPPHSLSEAEEWTRVTSSAKSPWEEMAVAPPQLSLQQGTSDQEIAAAPWSFDGQKVAGVLAGAYLAGAALCVLWMAAGSLLLLRIRQTAEQPPAWLASHFETLAKRAGIASPKLILSPLCSRPLTWGIVWPVVVLPRSVCRRENKSQLESVLLHELGHIAQQDAQGNLLLCAALPLLFAHPLYWWLRRESQLAAELVADDWAAWQAGKETYVEELVALARCTGKSSLPLVGVTGLFSSPSLFYRRMQMLLAREKPLSRRPSLVWRLASLSALAGSVALAASLAGVRPAAGQAPPSLEPPAAPGTPAPPAAPAPPGTTLPSAAAPGTTAPPSVPIIPTTPAPFLAPTAADPAPLELPVPRTGAAPLTPPALPGATPPVALPPPVPSSPYEPLPPARYGVVAESKPLDGEEAALLAEIKQLQAKLRDLESKRASKNPHPIQDVTIKANQVYIVRSDDKGATWVEAWTTDEQGRPSKILSKSAATYRAGLSADGKTVTQEFTNPDGSRVSQIIDGATGKVIAENRMGGKLPKKDPPASLRATERRYPTPILVPDPNASSGRVVELVQSNPVVVKQPQANAQPAGGQHSGQQLDLISLATSYADAVSVLEAADARMADIGRLGDAKAVSQQEVVTAKLALSAAQRKEQLLRRIAQVATENAARELETATQLHKQGLATAAAQDEAQSRLAILKQILGTRESSEEPKKP